MNFRSLAFSVSALLALGAATHVSAQTATLAWNGESSVYDYTATFDVNTGTTIPSLPTGWFISMDGVGQTPTSTISASATGAYFFRTTTSGPKATDYALGTFLSNGAPESFAFGIAISNNTGVALANLTIDLEATRYATSTVTSAYGFGSSLGTVSNWHPLADLNISNTQSLSTTLFSTGSGNSFANGSTLWIRWQDVGAGTVAIDDVYITATPVPEPSTYAMLLGLGTLGVVWYRRRGARQ